MSPRVLSRVFSGLLPLLFPLPFSLIARPVGGTT